MPDLIGIDADALGFERPPYGKEEAPSVAPVCEQCRVRLTRKNQGFSWYCKRCCPDWQAFERMHSES